MFLLVTWMYLSCVQGNMSNDYGRIAVLEKNTECGERWRIRVYVSRLARFTFHELYGGSRSTALEKHEVWLTGRPPIFGVLKNIHVNSLLA